MKPGVYKCTGKDCSYQTTIMVERSEKELKCPKCNKSSLVLSNVNPKAGFARELNSARKRA